MNRDKRTAAGRKRYVRQVGDHALLLPACACVPSSVAGKIAIQRVGNTCSFCDGAVLTADEKRAAAAPG